ncbi:MAG: CBS domain-containing protein [Chitinophagaceae bacterium]|jgi:predicted transcriptional regulator|nr:CBS domain-containing protein [Chitinophagaceae bacterium]MBK8300288.1 CBS domain-containing protein [Chitinophagaceae bacterium]MBK9464332.1 CBS domain-containing protein [Chitinophagaceae bacterium]MBK9658544.1 CBS domain-containing protein [Chitinophagaceae bacterium]MBK9938970.1 CBS domain-containing protein [Chitinophagaceae bacterium]
MLTRELLSQSLPSLRLSDKVYQALQLMNDNHVTHLPITEGEKFIGNISEEDLLLAENDHADLSSLEQSFSDVSVKEDEHFLKAVQLAADSGLSVVPVVSEENELVGTLAYNDLLKFSSGFMSLGEPGGLIVLEMESNQYSFNEISKLVETNDAQITQLNTSNNAETGMMQVTIRINKPDVADIVASFQRYEYNVKYFFGEELYTNELRSNYDNLMNYLKI